MREETTCKAALATKQKNVSKFKKDFGEIEVDSTSANAKENNEIRIKSSLPCQHCGKKGHLPFRGWIRPDVKRTKCNQMGHKAIICKNKNQQHPDGAKIIEQEEKDHLFIATCFSSIESSEN